LIEIKVSRVRGSSGFAEIAAEDGGESGGVADGDRLSGDGYQVFVAEFSEGAGERFATRTELGGEHAFSARQGDVAGLSTAVFYEPVDEAGFHIL
jgi:predicted NAD/FAD-dependent oxidoreductase